MTVLSETRQVRNILFVTAIVTSVLWGCATAGAVMVAGGALGHAWHRSDMYFLWVRFGAAVAGLSVTAIRIWRRRFNSSVARVGLWVEERRPQLHYALVTTLDPAVQANPVLRQPLESAVGAINLPEIALRAAVPAYVTAAVFVLVIAFLLSLVMPLSATDAGSGGAATVSARNVAAASLFSGLRAHVTPPLYAHQAAVDLDNPSTITALVGSTITLRRRDGWTRTLPMPREPTALELAAGAEHRVIALVPRADEPPTVVLDGPRADTTYRVAPATIVLEAHATDDIGLADGWFECIISTGQSEGNFKSVTDTVGRVRFAATRTGALRLTLPLGNLGLIPGTQLSIRAIARDGNTVTGPGVGSSDTRTLRIARPEEYDSLAIAAAAPPILDKALMSQRMLVIETEALVARRTRIDHAHWVSESVRLGNEEERLRQEVDDILNGAATPDSEGEVGEREDVDASKGAGGATTGHREHGFFQMAYQAMTDAASAFAVGLPDTALPPARRALGALDSARVMNRLYLRGTPPTIVVNTARVRLAGPPGGPTADTAQPAPRTPSPRADSLRAVVLRYIERSSPTPDSLSLLQVGALAADSALASALGDAAAAFRAHRDTLAALVRVRRAAAPRPSVTSGLAPATLKAP
jgi:hypothetical protein